MIKQNTLLRTVWGLFVVVMLLSAEATADESLTASKASAPLILAVHPYLEHHELLRRYRPLAEYLSQKISKKVTVRVGRSYSEHIQQTGEDLVDIAYLGPAGYVNVVDGYGKKPILARMTLRNTPYFHGHIFTTQNSNIETLEELKGKSFAFGDENSTMSHIVPRYMLVQAGITDAVLSHSSYLNSHHNVVLSVLAGDFDAGAVKDEVFHEFETKGLKEIAQTPLIPEHLFVTRSTLPLELITQLRHALQTLSDTADGRKILMQIKPGLTGFSDTKDSDYDELRRIIDSVSTYLKRQGNL